MRHRRRISAESSDFRAILRLSDAVYQPRPTHLLLDDASPTRENEEAAMRTYIDRFMSGISRDPRRRDDHRRVRLVPGAGRPRRARTTFVAVDPRAALAH